jgi:hypothetical protein
LVCEEKACLVPASWSVHLFATDADDGRLTNLASLLRLNYTLHGISGLTTASASLRVSEVRGCVMQVVSEAEGVRGMASSSSNLTFGLDRAEISKSEKMLQDPYQQIFFIHLEQDGGKVCGRKRKKKNTKTQQKGKGCKAKPRTTKSRAIHHLSPHHRPRLRPRSECGTTPAEIDFRSFKSVSEGFFQGSSVSFRKVTKRCFRNRPVH